MSGVSHPPPPHATLLGPGERGGVVALLGLRGSGKTTAGRWLAELWGWAFVDLDDRTPALLGCATAASALRAHGEPAFRAAEASALREALGSQRTILALGGGTPTAPGAAELLRGSSAALVYLRAAPATLRARLAGAELSARPALTGAGTLAEIEALFEARDPVYNGLCRERGAVVEVDGLGLADTIAAIDGALAERAG